MSTEANEKSIERINTITRVDEMLHAGGLPTYSIMMSKVTALMKELKTGQRHSTDEALQYQAEIGAMLQKYGAVKE
jgi:hypothetical protein